MVDATAKYVRISPRKARQVVELIRGKSIGEAEAILMLTPRGAAPEVRKVLKSAVANAENNHDLVADELYVARAFVNEGPTLRRFRPRAMGRATRIRKRTSHITISVDERKEQ
ncbi:MAG: 50S ribosomal protein L22 [Thermoleophilia bacterium]